MVTSMRSRRVPVATLAGIALSAALPTPLLRPAAAATPGEENLYYRLVTVAAPEAVRSSRDPDWKPPAAAGLPADLLLEVSGLAALDDGRLAVATRRGEIWLLSAADHEPPDRVVYRRFASGLHEPLGLLPRDGGLLVAQRSELTAITDRDGDGSADEYRTVIKGWGVTGHYHEYAYGPKPGPDGSLWMTLNTGLSLLDEHMAATVRDPELGYAQGAWRGWALEIPAPAAGEPLPSDGRFVPVCCGLRSPSGLGANAAGAMFATDQQGHWIATNSLVHLRPGAFFGHPDSLASRNLSGSPFAGPRPLAQVARVIDGLPWPEAVRRMPFLSPPAVWFPYRTMGQSTTDVLLDTSAGRFGPFGGQLFIGEFTQAALQRVFLEEVEGQWQGACFPFRTGFASAVLRLAQAADGSVFAGLTNRGWSSLGPAAYGLQRLVWTGRVPFEIHEMRARPDGFELRFTHPVDPETAGRPEAYAITSHTYLYHSKYGSDEIDTRDLAVTTATVAPDGLSVRLRVEGLRPLYVHTLEARGVRDLDGSPLLHPRAAYTLNRIPGR